MEAWRDELYHYGLKGMHWGIRRWQNEDGSFNAAGKERYFSTGAGVDYKPIKKNTSSNSHNNSSKSVSKTFEGKKLSDEQRKKIAKVAVAALATAAVVGGTIYLAKTGKLDSVISKGKDAIGKTKSTLLEGKNKVSGFAKETVSKVTSAKNNVVNGAKQVSNYTKNTVSSIKDKATKGAEFIRNGVDRTKKTAKQIGDTAKKVHEFNKKGAKFVQENAPKVKAGAKKVYDVTKKGVEFTRTNAPKVKAGVQKGVKVIRENAPKVKATAKQVGAIAKRTSTSISKNVRDIKNTYPQQVRTAALKYMGVRAYKKVANNSQTKKFVKAYKKDHPGTKMTDKQIARMYGG